MGSNCPPSYVRCPPRAVCRRATWSACPRQVPEGTRPTLPSQPSVLKGRPPTSDLQPPGRQGMEQVPLQARGSHVGALFLLVECLSFILLTHSFCPRFSSTFTCSAPDGHQPSCSSEGVSIMSPTLSTRLCGSGLSLSAAAPPGRGTDSQCVHPAAQQCRLSQVHPACPLLEPEAQPCMQGPHVASVEISVKNPRRGVGCAPGS